MLKKNILFLMLIITSVACKFNPNRQGSGSKYLQGVWQQEKAIYEDKLLAYTLHTFKFTCDSFYLTLDTHTKVNTYADSCFNKGHWTEYVKGVYAVNSDTLYLNGTFLKSNFKQKISGCYRIGHYLSSFSLKNLDDSTAIFQDVTQHVPLLLRLKQKTICIPQPIN